MLKFFVFACLAFAACKADQAQDVRGENPPFAGRKLKLLDNNGNIVGQAVGGNLNSQGNFKAKIRNQVVKQGNIQKAYVKNLAKGNRNGNIKLVKVKGGEP